MKGQRRRAITLLLARLRDSFGRTWRRDLQQWHSIDRLTPERRRQLANELGYRPKRRPAEPEAAPSPEVDRTPAPAAPEMRTAAGTGVEDGPPFLGLADLDALDPPPARGMLKPLPDHRTPLRAVAERLDRPSDGPAAEDVHGGPAPAKEEVVDTPEPDLRRFDRFGGPA